MFGCLCKLNALWINCLAKMRPVLAKRRQRAIQEYIRYSEIDRDFCKLHGTLIFNQEHQTEKCKFEMLSLT